MNITIARGGQRRWLGPVGGVSGGGSGSLSSSSSASAAGRLCALRESFHPSPQPVRGRALGEASLGGVQRCATKPRALPRAGARRRAAGRWAGGCCCCRPGGRDRPAEAQREAQSWSRGQRCAPPVAAALAAFGRLAPLRPCRDRYGFLLTCSRSCARCLRGQKGRTEVGALWRAFTHRTRSPRFIGDLNLSPIKVISRRWSVLFSFVWYLTFPCSPSVTQPWICRDEVPVWHRVSGLLEMDLKT